MSWDCMRKPGKTEEHQGLITPFWSWLISKWWLRYHNFKFFLIATSASSLRQADGYQDTTRGLTRIIPFNPYNRLLKWVLSLVLFSQDHRSIDGQWDWVRLWTGWSSARRPGPLHHVLAWSIYLHKDEHTTCSRLPGLGGKYWTRSTELQHPWPSKEPLPITAPYRDSCFCNYVLLPLSGLPLRLLVKAFSLDQLLLSGTTITAQLAGCWMKS